MGMPTHPRHSGPVVDLESVFLLVAPAIPFATMLSLCIIGERLERKEHDNERTRD